MQASLSAKTLPLDSLSRQIIGIDRLFNSAIESKLSNYPPYNIVIEDDDNYLLSVGVAGFEKESLSVVTNDDNLIIEGNQEKTEKEVKYLHRGIASRSFALKFSLGPHMKVKSAKCENGLLNILIYRDIPEEQKPKSVSIE